ncbi:MAG: Crp/Fnr family transcriptional regulator [Candidatus Melainabacteria bacterium]|nr:MAG: Crp/Fnr family transcriptional regulator [Candidatus Melainabacteria bacterium]
MSHISLVKNTLLRSLSHSALERMEGKLKHIELPRKASIAEKDGRFNYAYFPDEGMVSIVLVTGEGDHIEVGTVGKEGFVGIPILLGADISDRNVYSQVPGNGWKMETADFKRELEQNAELKALCQKFILTMFNQISQTAACNRLHTIEERCARWLLLAHDRDTSKTVDLTQEFLSMMLGVRRSGVNIAVKTLEAANLIEHGRGFVRIIDRRGMEEVSCGCYDEVKQYFTQTMGFSMASSFPKAAEPELLG